MRFLVDAQLPPALARWLEAQGHSADHVADLGLVEASDLIIWNAAADREAVIVTKDEDFVTLSAFRGKGPAVLWIRLGNTRTNELIGRMQTSLAKVTAALERGESIVEVV